MVFLLSTLVDYEYLGMYLRTAGASLSARAVFYAVRSVPTSRCNVLRACAAT